MEETKQENRLDEPSVLFEKKKKPILTGKMKQTRNL